MKRIQAYEGENLHSDFSFLEAESDDFFSTEDWDAETDFGTDWIDAVEAADAFDADSVMGEYAAARQWECNGESGSGPVKWN